jgi:hypothetical protein
MQIQSWEGAALSRAETVLQGTTHDTVRAGIGYGEKVSRRLWWKKLEEGIGSTARHGNAERPESFRFGDPRPNEAIILGSRCRAEVLPSPSRYRLMQ